MTQRKGARGELLAPFLSLPSIPVYSEEDMQNPFLSPAFFTAILPLPPGVNASYRIVTTKNRSRRLAASSDLAQFKIDAALLLCQATRNQAVIAGIQSSQDKQPLALDLTFYFSTLWKRDIDGGIKSVVDAVFTHLGLNDTLVVDLHVKKRVDASNPRVEIAVSCATDDNGID